MDADEVGSVRGTKRSAAEAGLPVEAPRRIKQLDQNVVNKIAAGEIIVAPVNALKEMMENSIDAGATAIEILVKDGGLKLLQITDNGHGIEKDDLPILCERFTTSKLNDFEDLRSIATYGFRGEALASISHIAHLRVTTKTASSSCAWKAYYEDGKLCPEKPGQSAEPKMSHGRPGTQILVEDLFYNIPTRRRAFRSPSEEYAKILDTVTRHAVHCERVSFSIKKHGDAGTGFSVAAATSKIDRIKQSYGAALARELIDFNTEEEKWGFKASGYCSTANHSAKRTVLLLFINNRSVDSSAFKKAVEQTYQAFLPKGGHPFTYLSLHIDPSRVDVNVHPTKREVHFLHEEEIIDFICNCIAEKLTQVDTSRAFKTQTLIPTIGPSSSNRQTDSNSVSDHVAHKQQPQTPASKRPYENNLVRTDSKLRKITSMLPPALTPSQSVGKDGEIYNVAAPAGVTYYKTEREQVQVKLTSVKTLRSRVRDELDSQLTEIFASLTYVGLVDPKRRLAAMQSGVNLYLVDYGMIANELFYQIAITNFGNFGAIQLRPTGAEPLPLKDILLAAAEVEIQQDGSMADLDASTIADRVFVQLFEKRDMLKEYFSLDIDDEGNLITIPLLIRDYLPCMGKLPTFLLRLGPFVNWTDELECFRTFLIELAGFYVPECLPETRPKQDKKGKGRAEEPSPSRSDFEDTNMQDAPSPSDDDDDDDSDGGREAGENDGYIVRRRTEVERALENVLFPAFRSRLLGTRGMRNGLVQIADLKGLYRTFERC